MQKKNFIGLKADPNDAEDFDLSPAAVEAGLRARRIRQARKSSGLSQEEFSRRSKIPLGTLRDWEQGRKRAPEYAAIYINAVARMPNIVPEKAA